MSEQTDKVDRTAEDYSVVEIPHGMQEVTREEFWNAVMSGTQDVGPSSQRYCTHWKNLRTGVAWGWTSRGYAGPFDHQGAPPERFALARIGSAS